MYKTSYIQVQEFDSEDDEFLDTMESSNMHDNNMHSQQYKTQFLSSNKIKPITMNLSIQDKFYEPSMQTTDEENEKANINKPDRLTTLNLADSLESINKEMSSLLFEENGKTDINTPTRPSPSKKRKAPKPPSHSPTTTNDNKSTVNCEEKNFKIVTDI